MKTKFLVLASLVVFLMCIGLQGVSLAGSPIVNRSFEDGTTGWNGLSGVTNIDSTVGSYSGVVDTTGWVTQGTASNPSIPVQPNTDYVLSFDARRIEEGWDGTELAVMINYGVSQTVIDIEGEVTPTWPALDYRLENGWYPSLVWYTYNTDWHHIKVGFNSGNFNNVYIGFRVKLGSLTQNILLDNFQMFVAQQLVPIVINRVVNPSFEDGTTGWNGLSGVTNIDSTAGGYSGVVDTTGWVTQGTASNPSIPVQKNTDYVLSFDTRAGGDYWTSLRIMISFGQSPNVIDINGTIDPAVNGYVINGGKFNGWWPEAVSDFFGIPGWRHITATFNSGNYDRIYISLYAALDAGESILLDNFQMLDTILVLPEIPPVADAGLDQTVECGALVMLDGSSSFDPNGTIASYLWTWSEGSASGVNPTITLPLGETAITLTVTDNNGATDTDEVIITVADTTPPYMISECGLVVINPGRSGGKGNSHSANAGLREVETAQFSDICDDTLDVVCTIDGIEVSDGQLVKVTKDPDVIEATSSVMGNGYLHIVGPTGILKCTAIDDGGNTTSCETSANVPPLN